MWFIVTDSLVSLIVNHLGGGLLGLASAGLASTFGTRSAERLPGESPLPQCLYCQRPLEWHEAFPLFGWLLRNKAETMPCPCGKRQGEWRQPITEMLGFVLGMIAVTCMGGDWDSSMIPLCLGLGLLPAIASIDLAYGLIPDMLNGALALLGAVWLLMSGGDFFMGLVGAGGLLAFGLLLALVYSRWRGRDMLGLGDVKFFAAAGFWVPVLFIPWFLAGAGFLGGLLGLYWQKVMGEKEFPFGPALCVSLAGCIFTALVLLSYI